MSLIKRIIGFLLIQLILITLWSFHQVFLTFIVMFIIVLALLLDNI